MIKLSLNWNMADKQPPMAKQKNSINITLEQKHAWFGFTRGFKLMRRSFARNSDGSDRNPAKNPLALKMPRKQLQQLLNCSLSLRVENPPSVLGIFICVPWGGVGWGNNVHVLAHSHDVTPRHVHLHVRGGVGWGNNVHVLAHSHDVTPRHVHLHVRTIAHIRHATLKMCHVTQGWGGVG